MIAVTRYGLASSSRIWTSGCEYAPPRSVENKRSPVGPPTESQALLLILLLQSTHSQCTLPKHFLFGRDSGALSRSLLPFASIQFSSQWSEAATNKSTACGPTNQPQSLLISDVSPWRLAKNSVADNPKTRCRNPREHRRPKQLRGPTETRCGHLPDSRHAVPPPP